MKFKILFLPLLLWINWASGAGLNWPVNQLLPTFSPPTQMIDCIDVSGASGPQLDLFASVEGIVNRAQPRVICVSTANGEGEFIWANLHNLATNPITGFNAILKYQTNFAGLVVTDPNEPDTLNLATSMAGVNNELICDPSLLNTLTNSPYNLPILDDLRGRFSNKYGVYGYLFTNYWPSCTHRILAGLETNVDGNLRDYLVATKTATVWLDPGSIAQDATLLARFTSQMTPANSVYIGWVPNEGADVPWLGTYGIPVVASDFFVNGSVFSGVSSPINVPPIPPPPPLQNKVYVALVLSDGDNVQYMQHAMKINWGNSSRGAVPIGWTVDALAANLDPVMLNYYWSTATSDDCLISGPSGAGYARVEYWSGANLAAFTSLADGYLQRSGLRVITVWDRVNTGIAQAYATNCPSLLGLTDQNGTYNAVNLGLRTIAETPTYASTVAQVTNAIVSAASGWNGAAPVFLVAQADAWSLVPSDLLNIANTFPTNEYVFVRPDHLFLLANAVYGMAAAITEPPTKITASTAILQGLVNPEATNGSAWLEWGTNNSYGFRTPAAAVSGTTFQPASAALTGLLPGTVYHYRVAVSNFLGPAWGSDRIFNTGGRLKAWGNGGVGQTNLPAGLTNVIGISCGAYHALALKSDGTVTSWGQDASNQTNVPPGLANVLQVAGGVQHSLALLTNGTVTAWGDNTYGQTNVPAGLSNVLAIAAGGFHSLALKSDGTVTAWGFNNSGQTNVPAGLTNAVALAAGRYHSVVLKSDGTVLAWGSDAYGQTNVPSGLGQVVAVSAGDYHTVALKQNADTLPNLLPSARWVADSLSGSNGTPVSNWTDLVAGAGASQGAAGSQPLLYTNSLNGHSVVRFAGTNSQYLTVPSAVSPISGATNFTLVAVFRTVTPGLASNAFYNNTGLLGAEQSGVVNDWALCLNGSELGAGLGSASSSCNADVSLYGGSVVDGNAHIALYMRTGSVVRLYVDGVIVVEQNPLCTAARGNYDFQIGAMSTTSGFFTGDLAEVQVFNRALSSWEISTTVKALAGRYGAGGVAGAPTCRWVADSLAGLNASAISNWTDVIGGASASQSNLGNQPRLYLNDFNGHKGVRFLGANDDYMTVAASNSVMAAAGSFAMVVVFRTSTAGNVSSSFFDNTGLLGAEQPGVVSDWAFCLNGSQLGAGLGAGGSGCSTDFGLYGGNVTDGNPHVGIYERSGSTITLYVDGAVVATQGSLCPNARGDYPFQIGAMTTSSYFYNGDIAEIQLFNRALSAQEILGVNESLASTYNIGGAAGTLVVWGNNANGQTNVPVVLTNVSVVASGSTFNLALQSGGAITGWGNNSQDQLTQPAGLTNVAAIAGGTNFTLAIADETPLVSNASFSGYENHDLAFTLPAASPDGTPLNYHILSLPAAGSLYQFSSGGRGDRINGANTLVTNPAGQVIFAPATGSTGAPYAAFNFMCDDGAYSSATAQVTVNIALPVLPQWTSALWMVTNSAAAGFSLVFTGSSNANYSVWAGTNLLNWLDLGTATEFQPGQYQFMDAAVTNCPVRFYRLSAP